MKANNSKVSIIMVTWNVENIIEKCLDSLFKFIDVNYEVIIVDNASNDNTCKVIKSKYNEKVNFIESKVNLGFSKANNLALSKATGEYIFYLNPDVIFIESIIRKMIKILEENPSIGIISPKLLNNDMSLQISYSNFPSVSKILFDDFKLGYFLPKKYKLKFYQSKTHYNKNRLVDWTHGAAHLCRYSELKVVNGYPDSYFMYGEDTEFCKIYLNKLKKYVYYYNDCSLIHIGGYSEKQVINSKKIIYGTNASLYFIKKYDGKIKLLVSRILLVINYGIKFIVFKLINMFNRKNEIYIYKKNKFKLAFETVLKYKNQIN